MGGEQSKRRVEEIRGRAAGRRLADVGESLVYGVGGLRWFKAQRSIRVTHSRIGVSELDWLTTRARCAATGRRIADPRAASRGTEAPLNKPCSWTVPGMPFPARRTLDPYCQGRHIRL